MNFLLFAPAVKASLRFPLSSADDLLIRRTPIKGQRFRHAFIHSIDLVIQAE